MSALASEPQTRSFNVPADVAERTLALFAEQSGRNMVVGAATVKGVKTNAVVGEFTPRDALTRMLTGTGLTATHDEKAGAFTVTREAADPKASRAAPATDGRPATSARSDEAVELSPFVVASSKDVGYAATETLAGSRFKSELKDIATQVNVMTPEFLEDLAVTNLNDAMRYSLNAENDDEVIEVTAPGSAGVSATTRPFNGGGRTRGIGPSNRAHDFFDTFLSIDSYNTERFTFSSGPNSILFGNANPAGTIDTTFKRARLQRSNYGVSYRLDDRGSNRAAVDLNQPILRGRLALRVNVLRDRDHDWRAPAFTNQDRLFATVSYTPFRILTLRAYHETATIYSNPARNTLVQDHVTPWINAGRPAFNNGGGTAAAFPAVTAPFSRRAATTPYLVLDHGGAAGPVTAAGNTVFTLGFESVVAAPNNFERSVLDQSLFPYDRNFSGNANQAKINARIRGAIAELNPFANFFVEAGFNQERFRSRAIDFFNNQVADLYVDANRFLNDRLTPNPFFGRYFFEDTVTNSSKNHGAKEQRRVSLSYELDLERRGGVWQWLGRHRLAALFDRLETATVFERSDMRVVGDYSFTTAVAATRTPNVRYYLDPKHQTVFLPFYPLVDGPIAVPGAADANGRPLVLASWEPSILPSVPEVSRSTVNSRSFALQSFFWRNRIVASLGERRDAVTVQDSASLTPNWDFGALIGSIPWQTVRDQSPRTRLKSIVVHPAGWLSLSYVQSNSEQVSPAVRRNIDGTLATFASGVGKEYGFTLRLPGRLSLRLSRYENTSVGNLSSQRSARPTPTLGAKGNIIRNDVANIENTVRLAGGPLSERFRFYDDELARRIPLGGNAGSTFQDLFDILSDQKATGWEATLVGNPTPQWRLSLGVAQNESKESNIAPQYFEFIKERLPVWARYGSTPITATPNMTIGQLLPYSMQAWNYIRQSEGLVNQQGRKYRVTATTRHGFAQGWLRGSFVGANYIWRSPAAVGFQTRTIADNEFAVPGFTTGPVEINDLTRPIRSGALTSFDVFLGYGRKLWSNKIAWRVQLNVRNALDDRGLLVQRALTDRTGAIYTAQQPRLFILTNAFEF